VTAVDHLAGAFETLKGVVLGVGLDQLGDAAAKSRLEMLDRRARILDGVVKEPGEDGLPVIPPVVQGETYSNAVKEEGPRQFGQPGRRLP
jgi:hypothetical protein